MRGRSLLFFCPVCWAEVGASARICPRCGADMEAVQQGRDFVDKLIAALSSVAAEERWLNRNVVGTGVTSLLSDWGHEMATAILPAFLAVMGAPAAALGAIEGVADAVSSFVKLGAGWYTDRIGHRKAICVGGYFLGPRSAACPEHFGAGWSAWGSLASETLRIHC